MSKLNILYFDIETSPLLVWTHYIGQKVSIHPQQIQETKKVICISYAWNNEKVQRLEWKKTKNGFDDTEMLIKFNKIAAKADVLIGHNGDKFDAKELRTHMALRGVDIPWCNAHVFDTLKDYRRSFRFNSNRLDAIAQELGLGHKNPMCFQDWIDVTLGLVPCSKTMGPYCDKDVRLLRKVHKRLEKYTVDTVKDGVLKSQGVINSASKCNECNSLAVIKWGTRTLKGMVYQRYLCKNCNHIYYGDGL